MNFAKAQKTYNQNAIVQKEMAKKLFKVFEGFSLMPSKMLEIGSGTGFLTSHLLKAFPEAQIFLNDINANQTGFSSPKFLQGNICEVEIPQELDLVVSNAVFQWVGDLDELFQKLYCALAPGGLLAFSAFGPLNYKQFGEQDMLNYPSLSELEYLLTRNSFEILYLEHELKTLYFQDAREVLEHVRATGVTTFSTTKRGMWTKETLKTFEETYLAQNSSANGVELTYHPLYCCAKKI